jgi:hypothetical protein
MDRIMTSVRPGYRLFALVGLLFAGDIQLGWTPTHPEAATITIWNVAAQWAPTRVPLVVAGHILRIVEGSDWVDADY